MNGDTSPVSLQVCVRVRPLFEREKEEGNRVCVHYDQPTKQVVLTAVDRSTLAQLRGHCAKGFTFDRYYSPECTSDVVYGETVARVIENCFKGYNGTVLAYGQTGSGKTHTMSGGTGIHGITEEGIIPKVIHECFRFVEKISQRSKPGEGVEITASCLEIYNEELVDLSPRKSGTKLKIQERSLPQGGNSNEVLGLSQINMASADELLDFFEACMNQRSTSCTKLNDRSSRSHAVFTVYIHQSVIHLHNELDSNFKARITTEHINSKLHLVDLAGSERVKRSGASGQQLKEASHINGGLLALGNVIVALSKAVKEKKMHIPYRDSKLTRLLEDSLGGNSLTVVITCISSSEKDFEETSNTLKYANRASAIKNSPLPNKYLQIEEDLLPMAPTTHGTAGFGVSHISILMQQHEKLKATRAQRAQKRAEKSVRKALLLDAARCKETKTPGYQRIRAHEYDRLRKEKAKGKIAFGVNESVAGDTLTGFRMKKLAKPPSVYCTSRRPASALPVRSNDPQPWNRPQSAILQGFSRIPKRPTHNERTATRDSSCGTTDLHEWPNSHAASSPATGVHEQPAVNNSHDSAKFEVACIGTDSRWNGENIDDLLGVGSSAENKESVADSGDEGSVQSESRTRTKAGGSSSDAINSLWSDDKQDSNKQQGNLMDRSGDYSMTGGMINDRPNLLARFRLNKSDVISVFKLCSEEDYEDVMSLLPSDTPLPASTHMTYIIARLETHPSLEINLALDQVAAGQSSLKHAIGPVVGCLMATFGTNMIKKCIFDFQDPAEMFEGDERIELWGLQIPHNSARPSLEEIQQQDAETSTSNSGSVSDAPEQSSAETDIITWSSVDRLNMSVGLVYALCNLAAQKFVSCGFCVPRPQLLRRWCQAGVYIKEIETPLTLIYPQHAHDFEYYKSSTVAYFVVGEVLNSLSKKLAHV